MKYTNCTVIDFGQHAGQPLEELPSGYLLQLYDLGIDNGPLGEYIEERIPVLKWVRQFDDGHDP
jgi:uncharacterized protein (DUF3820 family)